MLISTARKFEKLCFWLLPYLARGEGEMRKASALISAINNFLGVHDMATKLGDLFPHLLENEILENKNESRVSLIAMAAQYLIPCFAKFCFLVFSQYNNETFQACQKNSNF